MKLKQKYTEDRIIISKAGRNMEDFFIVGDL